MLDNSTMVSRGSACVYHVKPRRSTAYMEAPTCVILRDDWFQQMDWAHNAGLKYTDPLQQ